MALDLSTVLGAPPAAPAPEAPAESTEEVAIPDAVLEIPEIAALLQGTPPAIWTTRGDPSPEVATVIENLDAMVASGFGFYGGKDGETTVLFNTQHVSPEEIQAADNKGKLREFATSFAELKADLAPAGSAPEAPSAAAPPSMAAASPGAGFDKRVATKRLKNIAVGSPTSGPSPGAGRLMNSILTPTV